ncbi:hypothetical protein AHAS_Ahas05G0156900 [Arachis hypogaea]
MSLFYLFSDVGQRKGKSKGFLQKKGELSVVHRSATSGYSKITLSDKDKVDQLLPTANLERFPNMYCDLRFPLFQQWHLNLEKKLAIPSNLRRSIELQIEGMGLSFVDRELPRVNKTWVREFYCNFFRPTLNSIHLRGGRF